MRHTIDKTLKVSWCAELNDGSKVFDEQLIPNQRSAWLRLKTFIKDHPEIKINRLHLFLTRNSIDDVSFNGVLTPVACEGYFHLRKLLAASTGGQYDTWAIGYLKDNIVNIRWFDDNMSCVENETRTIEQAEFGLIK